MNRIGLQSSFMSMPEIQPNLYRELEKDDIVIVLPLRTAIGSFGGSLSGISAPELGSKVVREIFERTGVSNIHEKVDTLIAGQVLQTGSKMNPARQIEINSGINESATAQTINMACGSGLEAVITAAEKIRGREYSGVELAIAGGVENMSRVPFYVEGGRKGFGLGDQKLVDGVVEGLTDVFNNYHMGITAENVAEIYGVTREAADSYALRSQRLAVLALKDDYFKATIVPIEVKRGRETDLFEIDEYVRGETTKESLAKLKPAFKQDGIVTAGNASGINDGAAFMIVTSAGKAEELGLEPSMRLVSYAEEGVAPEVMGLGSISASKKALERAGLDMSDIDIAEINEAFANLALVCGQELGATNDQLNPLGGAVALGHPIGATGAILVTKIESFFKNNRDSRYALASLCIGGGQGIAAIFEKV